MRCAVIACIVLALAPAAARADSEAERLFLAGQRAYDGAHYDDALASWENSFALSKLPALLFNIAQAQRLRGRAGDCTRASTNYKKFIELAPRATERGQAEGFIAELAPCVAGEAKPVPPPAAVQPPPTDPTTTVIVAPPPTEPTLGSPGRTKRLAGYAVAGGGLLLVVTGVYFGAKARRLGNEVSDECADGCDWNLVADKDAEGRSAERTQYILYGVGGAAIVAGGVLYWLGSKERTAAVAITPHAGGAAVTWSGAW